MDSNLRLSHSLLVCLAFCSMAHGQSAVSNQADSGQTVSETEIPQGAGDRQQMAPVVITMDAAGNLVLQSNDPAALDRLEQIMQANRPPRRPYDIFKVEHARASWIKLNLDEYFEDADEKKNSSNRFYFYDYNATADKEKNRQLGDKPPLRFIADNDTNSIVVQGADELSRQTIKDLIKLWDVPEKTDEDAVRYTRLVRIQYSRAEAIANSIKEAYRDLLSANDKTFQAGDEEGGKEKRNGDGGSVKDGGGMSFAFKGRLSLGVETVTNSILVSAEGTPLLDLVCKMITELDEAARREGSFEVYTLDPSINSKSVREALTTLFAAPKTKPNAQANQPKEGQEPAPEASKPDAPQRTRGTPAKSRN